ncbi:6-carboxytetrahydropterin synthase [Pyrobaculum ferrireducens]|uniref:6-carboxytetrahydropterin synthase n=1 Tax=Pyrobaculum ferrireducens TaxID=1104324 RepID=UPI0011E559A0|nr:6-carboxytetrahydropterin synthase [Pyrobaculum ferrireducens]
MRTCVELRGSISVAHRPAFSPAWGRVHGHDYHITAGFCRDGYHELVADAAEVGERFREILARMDGRYLASSSEPTQFGGDEVYVVPCGLAGVSGECLARHIAELIGATWVRVCESGLWSPCFYFER